MAPFNVRKHLSMEFSISKERLIPYMLFLIGGVLLFYNAGNYFFWGDEAVTALHGKNILKFGLPYGFDGRNLHEFSGYYLNYDFLPLLDPWAQFYVAAASFGIFGITSFGGRALFIIFGFAAMVMQYLFVSEYFKNQRLAAINLLFIVTSVSFLLYARQCRYYPLGMFLTPAIGYFYTQYKDRHWEVILLSLVFSFAYFSNSLIGVALLGSMAISFFMFDNRNKALRFFLKPLPLMGLIIGVYSLWLYRDGFSGTPTNFKNIHPYDFSRIIWLYFKDYNLTQLLPFGMFIILILMWIKNGLLHNRNSVINVSKELSIIVLIVVFTILISILSPQISSAKFSDIRYAAPVFSMLLLVQAFAIEKIFNWRKWQWLGYVLLIAAVFTNIMTFNPFRSYLYDYIKENIKPFDNSVKVAVLSLENMVRDNDIVFVCPNHMLAPLEFYLGDKVLFCNVVGEDSYNLSTKASRLPRYVYSSDIVPDWIVFFGLGVDLQHTAQHLNKLNLSHYKIYTFPILGTDVSRPELFWRSFVPISQFPPKQGLFILESINGTSSKHD